MGTLIGALIGALIGLIGVILVSIIGYAAVITTLVVEHRRWKKEFKLQYLITERSRREGQCDRIKELFDESVNNTDKEAAYELGTFIGSRLPIKVAKLIGDALKERDCSDEGLQKLPQKVSFILSIYLSEIDKQIEELTQ